MIITRARKRDRVLIRAIREHGICPGVEAALVNSRIVPRKRPARLVSRIGLRWVRWLHGVSAERARLRMATLRRFGAVKR